MGTLRQDVDNLNDIVIGDVKNFGLRTEVELMKSTLSEIKWWLRSFAFVIGIYILNLFLGLIQIPAINNISQEIRPNKEAASIEITITPEIPLPATLPLQLQHSDIPSIPNESIPLSKLSEVAIQQVSKELQKSLERIGKR